MSNEREAFYANFSIIIKYNNYNSFQHDKISKLFPNYTNQLLSMRNFWFSHKWSEKLPLCCSRCCCCCWRASQRDSQAHCWIACTLGWHSGRKGAGKRGRMLVGSFVKPYGVFKCKAKVACKKELLQLLVTAPVASCQRWQLRQSPPLSTRNGL